uniref:RNA-dependent RNA polymerase n=1 Tax=Shahe bunya-like virus 2 TaxID=1923411 RepID=A0A1L3KPK8_9VIRU|nr:RNA-dependent RNA polymerase [Shahe bunya-like virus 2]
MSEVERKKIIFEGEEDALTISTYIRMDEEIPICVIRIVSETNFSALGKVSISETKRNDLCNWEKDVNVLDMNGALDVSSVYTCLKIARGAQLRKCIDEMLDLHIDSLRKMFLREAHTKGMELIKTKKEIKDAAKVFSENLLVESLDNIDVGIDGDIDQISEHIRCPNVSDEGFIVQIKDREENELKTYVEALCINYTNAKFGLKGNVPYCYTESELKRFDIYKKATSASFIYETDVEMKDGKMVICTKSVPDVNDILNRDLISMSTSFVLNRCKQVCKEIVNNSMKEDVEDIDKMSERQIRKLIQTLSYENCQKLKEGENDGLSIMSYILDEKLKKNNQSIRQLHLQPVMLAFEKSENYSMKKTKRMYSEIKAMLTTTESVSDRTSVEILGRLKGLCCELLMSVLFNVDYYYKDDDKKINNLGRFNDIGAYLKSRTKLDRLLITDIIKDTGDCENSRKRVEKIIENLKEFGSNVEVRLSEGFNLMNSLCFIEVGCKNMCKEKAEQDFATLSNSLKKEACFGSICFSRFSELLKFLNRKDIMKLMDSSIQLMYIGDDGLIENECENFVAMIKAIGELAEKKLSEVMREVWDKDVFDTAKDILGFTKVSRTTFLNCPYVSQNVRDNVIKGQNEMITSDLEMDCVKQKRLIEEEKRSRKTGSGRTPDDIENIVIRTSKAVVEEILREQNDQGESDWKCSKKCERSINELLRQCTLGSEYYVEFLRSEGLGGKNSYFEKKEGRHNEDSILVIAGLSDKYKEEGLNERDVRVKNFKRLGDIDVEGLCVMKRDEPDVEEKETDKNVLLALYGDRGRSTYTRTNCSFTIANMVVYDLCSIGKEEEKKEILCSSFLRRKRLNMRDVYRNIVNVCETIVVNSYRHNEKMIKLTRREIYNTAMFCKGTYDCRQLTEVVKMDVVRKERCEYYVAAFWICCSMIKQIYQEEGGEKRSMITSESMENKKLLEDSMFLSEEFQTDIKRKEEKNQGQPRNNGDKESIVEERKERELVSKLFNNSGWIVGEEDSASARMMSESVLKNNRRSFIQVMRVRQEKVESVLGRIKSCLTGSLDFELNLFRKSNEGKCSLGILKRIFYRLCNIVFFEVDNVDGEVKVDELEPCWMDEMSNWFFICGLNFENIDNWHFDYANIEESAIQILCKTVCLPKSIYEISDCLKDTGNKILSEKVLECEMPNSRNRYIITETEKVSEDHCRRLLISKIDYDEKIQVLMHGKESVLKEKKEKNSKVIDLFEIKLDDFDGDIDLFGDLEEEESVANALGLDSSQIGRLVVKNYQSLRSMLNKQAGYKRSCFERAIARALVRCRSMSSRVKGCLSRYLRGYNCTIVTKNLGRKTKTYEFCLYDDRGGVVGPVIINEQKLNFLLSAPSVLTACYSGNIDNCVLSQEEYIKQINSETETERQSVKKGVKKILELVQKMNLLLCFVDGFTVCCFINTILFSKKIIQYSKLRSIEDFCHNKIRNNLQDLKNKESAYFKKLEFLFNWLTSDVETVEDDSCRLNEGVRTLREMRGEEKDSIDMNLFLIAVKIMCAVYRGTEDLKKMGFGEQKIFNTLFLDVVFKCMKENNNDTNEQMQKTRFLIMHKLGHAGAYRDFGKKLFTEGRKSSVTMTRLLQLWSSMYGAISNKESYLCTQSDLAHTNNMKHLITEMYYNQYFCKMLLSSTESIKEVTLKVFERVVDWKLEIRKMKCEGGENCYCDKKDEVSMRKKMIMNCLMCLDIYGDVSMKDEMKFCLLKQNKYASCSPKMSKLLFEHYAETKEEQIRSDLKKSRSIEENDLISMSKSTGMVEKIEKSVDLNEFYKSAYWSRLCSLRSVVADKKMFEQEKSEGDNLRDIKQNIERLLKYSNSKAEKEILENEMKLAESKKKRVLEELENMLEGDEIFERCMIGSLSRDLFKLRRDLRKGEKRENSRNNNVLSSVLSRCSGLRARFFKNSTCTRDNLKREEKEEGKSIIEKLKGINDIINFYVKNIKESGLKDNVREDFIYNTEKDDKVKRVFPDDCCDMTSDDVLKIIGLTTKRDDNVRIETKSRAYHRKLGKDVNLGFEDEFKRSILRLFFSIEAFEIGMMRAILKRDSLIRCKKFVSQEERCKWDPKSDENEFDENDLKFVMLGYNSMTKFISLLEEFRCDDQICFTDVCEEFDVCLCSKEYSQNDGWPIFPDVVNKKIIISTKRRDLDFLDEKEQENLANLVCSFINQSSNEVRIFESRVGSDENRARDMEVIIREIKKKCPGSKLSVSFKVENKDKIRSIAEILKKTITMEEKLDLDYMKENLENIRQKLEEGLRVCFDEVFYNVKLTDNLKVMFDRVTTVENKMETLSKDQREKVTKNILKSKLLEDDVSDMLVNELVKEQRLIVKDLIELIRRNKRNSDLVLFFGSLFCVRGILKIQKLESSIVPFCLDIDYGAKTFFSSNEMVKGFNILCIMSRSTESDMHSYLFPDSIKVTVGKDKFIDFTKTLLKKNFLYNFYELQTTDDNRIKEGVKRRLNYKTSNAKKNKGAFLIAERVYNWRQNELVYNLAVELLSNESNVVRHQTTIAPKNQLGAARDLKVQTLDSCIIQSTIEMVSSNVYKSMKRNTITDKFCKSKFLTMVEKTQRDVGEEREHYFMSKDGESWGPKMKGGHIIKGLATILRKIGYDELAELCDMISEVWDNRETEISGAVIEGYMRSMINKRVTLESGIDTIVNELFDEGDNLNRELLRHLYKGKKTMTLPIHMGQGLLQSTSTGIQALISNFLERCHSKINDECSSAEMIAGSDDSALTVTFKKGSSIKKWVDIVQVVSSSLNVNDSCKSSISKKVLEFHSVFVSDGEQTPAKEKFNSSILFVGKDSSIKGFFESSYNLTRQLISNSGDLSDVYSVMVGRVSSILGTLNSKQKKLMMECLSGPLSWGGLPPFEVINYAVMRKEDFTLDTRVMLCLNKIDRGRGLSRVEKSVLVNMFLEKKREFETGSVFVNDIGASVDKQLDKVSQMEPAVNVGDDVRNFIELAMSQNKVSDKKIDVLRMKQVLWSMKNSGSLRNEDNLNVLHIFHRNCSENCVLIENLPSTISSIIQKSKQPDLLEKKVIRNNVCSIEDMLRAYNSFFFENQHEIIDYARRQKLSFRPHCRRLSKVLNATLTGENNTFGKVMHKIVLFDRRGVNIINSALNTILWKVDKDTLRELGVKRIDEMEIADDYLRLSMMSEEHLNDAVDAVRELKNVEREKIRENIDRVMSLIERVESKPTSFTLYTGIDSKGYHKSGQAFYQTSSVKGKHLELVDDSLPEFIGNSARGIAKECLGFLCSIIQNATDCKRMIRAVYGQRLTEEEERELECKESIIGCLRFSKIQKDIEFLELHKQVIETELDESYSQGSDIISRDIYFYSNDEKTILDFILNGGAKLRFYILENGCFMTGCRVSSEDLKSVVVKSFEVISRVASPDEIRQRIRRLRMLECSQDVPKVNMISSGACYYSREGIPFFEIAEETEAYNSDVSSRRLIKNSIEKKKYGFILTKESIIMKSQLEEKDEMMNNVERINIEKTQRSKRGVELLTTPIRANSTRFYYTGSKVFSEAVVRLCVKVISQDETIIIRLRKNYGESFLSHIDFISNGTQGKVSGEVDTVKLKLRDAIVGDKYVQSRYGIDVKAEWEKDDLEIVYSSRRKEEEIRETLKIERFEKSVEILLVKMIRDIKIVEVLKETYNNLDMDRVLSTIDTRFVSRLEKLRDEGLSKLIAYLFNYYSIEKKVCETVEHTREYLRRCEGLLTENRLLLSYEIQSMVLRSVKGEKKSLDVSVKLKKKIDKQTKRRCSEQKEIGKIWCNLATTIKTEIANSIAEMECVIYQSTFSLDSICKSGDTKRDKANRVLDYSKAEFRKMAGKLDQIIQMFYEVFICTKLSKFEQDERNEIMADCYNRYLEEEKMNCSGIGWVQLGIYPKIEVNKQTDIITFKMCIRTGLKYETNCILRALLNSETLIETMSCVVMFSRTIREAKRVIKATNKARGFAGTSKIEERRDLKGEASRQEGTAEDWFNDLLGGDEENDVDEKPLTGTDSSRDETGSTIESDASFDDDTDDFDEFSDDDWEEREQDIANLIGNYEGED